MFKATAMPTDVRLATAAALGLLYLLYLAALISAGMSMSSGFQWGDAVKGSAISFGPSVPLLLLLWPLSQWLERRRLGLTRSLLVHLGVGLVFVLLWHALTYTGYWLLVGRAAAERARGAWFLWQGLWGLTTYAAMAGGFTAYQAVQRASREAAARHQAQGLLAQTELAALRNKLNPHFLFNTLHSILALVRRDAKQAEQALLQFSDLLRQLLDQERHDSQSVSLDAELAFTRDYLALEALRLGARLSVHWDIEDAALACRVPLLSVQPLVENAIKHAISPRSAPGTLAIEAHVHDGQLRVAVRDDGPGAEASLAEASQGLGLRTVSRRLELAHGPAARLQLHTQPGNGFAVSFEIPVGVTP